jgi:hypothetical protein
MERPTLEIGDLVRVKGPNGKKSKKVYMVREMKVDPTDIRRTKGINKSNEGYIQVYIRAKGELLMMYTRKQLWKIPIENQPRRTKMRLR